MAKKLRIIKLVKLTAINTDTPWHRVESEESDWKEVDHKLLTQMLEQLFIIRSFEEKSLDLFKAGCIHGPAHASIGQEGGAIAAMSVLNSKDKINATHRAHHQFLSKFLFHKSPVNYDPRESNLPEELDDVIYRSLSEIMGLKDGYCGGRGGSMHMRWDEAGVLGTNAIVGGNPPQAVGYALAEKLRNSNQLTVTFFGDGSMQNGAAYEALNLGALYDLPIIFFNENNLYGVSTHVSETTRETRLTARGLGLGIPSLEVDGMDIIAVRKAMLWAKDYIAKNKGPVLIESQTYRYFHQHGPMRGSAFGYRNKSEEEKWVKKDPFVTFPKKLIDLKIITSDSVEEIKSRSFNTVKNAASRLTETSPDGSNQLQVRSEMWPQVDTVEHGIKGDLSELGNQRFIEIEDIDPKNTKEMKFIEAIAAVQLRAMERDERVFIMGEDVQHLKGGTVGATKGILERFPERLIGTPIAENGFCGMGLGAAVNGMKPIVEIMYSDFILVAADQLFNQIGKVRHMFGGNHSTPLILRTRAAGGGGYGSQHSMDPSGIFAAYPGWRVIAPSNAFDYIGLFNSAILCDDPVAIIECQSLYQDISNVPEGDLDYCIPFGKAKIVSSGRECTIISCANMVASSIKAAAELDIDADIIDLRTVDTLSLDWETIGTSIKKTNKVMVVEQTARGHGLGARIVQEIQERFFDWLDHEVIRISGTHSAPVVSKPLEAAALAGMDDIKQGILSLCKN
tara:strand:+ start:39979 stop:42183 length:2205 start_codon:yes stop_codon:yes gene_type:complete